MAMQLLEPFAIDGLREDFDINPSPENDMSVNKGFTALFQLKPEEGGKFIDMLKFNQLLYLMSKSNVEFTTQSFPSWIDDKGDGLPYAYPKNAIVKYTNGNNYVSLVNNNTQVPTGANWKIFDITALDNTVKLIGNQTIAGVKTFSSSPIVPTPTAGTQAVNKEYADLKVALTDFTGANQSLTNNGYQKLPGGLIIQWGLGANTITFPIAFPNAVFAVVLTHGPGGTSAIGNGIGNLWNTYFDSLNPAQMMFIAIGY